MRLSRRSCITILRQFINKRSARWLLAIFFALIFRQVFKKFHLLPSAYVTYLPRA
jgi:hypothetical protein